MSITVLQAAVTGLLYLNISRGSDCILILTFEIKRFWWFEHYKLADNVNSSKFKLKTLMHYSRLYNLWENVTFSCKLQDRRWLPCKFHFSKNSVPCNFLSLQIQFYLSLHFLFLANSNSCKVRRPHITPHTHSHVALSQRLSSSQMTTAGWRACLCWFGCLLLPVRRSTPTQPGRHEPLSRRPSSRTPARRWLHSWHSSPGTGSAVGRRSPAHVNQTHNDTFPLDCTKNN